MTQPATFGDVTVAVDGHIAFVEMHRPPHNYLDVALVREVTAAFEHVDRETDARAIVFSAEGRSFSAGAQLAAGGASADVPAPGDRHGRHHLYPHVVHLVSTETPIVAAVQGPAIGAGLGLALVADFRVAGPRAWFAASFSRLGFHHGFGLSATLPDLIGKQAASYMLLTGRRVSAEEALRLGLCDALTEQDADLLPRAHEMAREIAAAAPLAVRSIRRTLRHGLADRIQAATDREQVEQDWLRRTDDFREGVRATAERREPDFQGR